MVKWGLPSPFPPLHNYGIECAPYKSNHALKVNEVPALKSLSFRSNSASHSKTAAEFMLSSIMSPDSSHEDIDN